MDAIEEINPRKATAADSALAAWAAVIASREPLSLAPKNNDSQATADVVVLAGTPSQLKTRAFVDLAQARTLLGEADLLASQAQSKNRDSQRLAEKARADEAQARQEDLQAKQAQRDADEAKQKKEAADKKAENDQRIIDVKKDEAFQATLEGQVERTQGQQMVNTATSQDELNRGVYLLNLADTSMKNANSLQGEIANLNGAVAISVALSQSSQLKATESTRLKGELETSAADHHHSAQENNELSGRAREASDALKLDSAGRREAAHRLLLEGDAANELADLGDQVQGGYLLMAP